MEEREFYREEVRCGFPVTEKMKRVWAVQLSMLDEVERICRKYGLRYFADSGTLIGAVRDKGYIPWDDDIDLAMLREDYERFVKVAPRELGEGLKLQTVYTEENYLRGHAQIRDGRTTGYNEEDARAGTTAGFSSIFSPWTGCRTGSWRPGCGHFRCACAGWSSTLGTGMITMRRRPWRAACSTGSAACSTFP